MIEGAADFSSHGMAAFTGRTLCIMSICELLPPRTPRRRRRRARETLATTMSMPPSASALAGDPGLERAPCRRRRAPGRSAVTPLPCSAATVASTSAALRAQIETFAPSSARMSAQRRPMPLVPPVTSARSPFSPRSMPSPPQPRYVFSIEAPERVLGVDHVADPHPAGLGAEEIGLGLLEAVVGDHPADQIAIGDAGGVLHRAGAADRHDEVRGLQPHAGDAPALDQVEPDRDRRRDLDGDAAELAVALPPVAVAEVEIGVRAAAPGSRRPRPAPRRAGPCCRPSSRAGAS